MEKSCKIEVKCGMVEPGERDEIKELHLRKIALTELFLSLSKLDTLQIDKLYNRIVIDMGKTSVAFQDWWDKKSKEYKIAEPIFQKFLDKAKIKNSGIIFKNIVINNYFRKYNKNLSSYIY